MLREKTLTLQAVIYFYFILLTIFLLLDNSIAYMFIDIEHAYAHILLHKMDGSKRNILKAPLKHRSLKFDP